MTFSHRRHYRFHFRHSARATHRVCPGRHFAEASLFIMIASVLHTLTIDSAVDERGKPIAPEAKMTYGVIS